MRFHRNGVASPAFLSTDIPSWEVLKIADPILCVQRYHCNALCSDIWLLRGTGQRASVAPENFCLCTASKRCYNNSLAVPQRGSGQTLCDQARTRVMIAGQALLGLVSGRAERWCVRTAKFAGRLSSQYHSWARAEHQASSMTEPNNHCTCQVMIRFSTCHYRQGVHHAECDVLS